MIQVNETRHGFSVYFQSVLVIEHTKTDPFIKLGQGKAQIQSSHGNYTIQDNLEYEQPCLVWELEQVDKNIVTMVCSELLRVKFCASQVSKDNAAADESLLTCSFELLKQGFNRFWINITGEHKEHIYGCGEQYSVLDLKGSRLPLWVEEQGVGRGTDIVTLLANLHSQAGGHWYSTYFPRPGYVTTRNMFVHLHSTAYALFDFTQPQKHILHIHQIPPAITIGVGNSFIDTVKKQNRFLGLQPTLPEWTYDGMWLGVQGGTEEVEKKLKLALEAGVKVGAIWAQDWEGKRITSFGKQLMWDWIYDPQLYPDLPEYINKLNGKNIRFLGYINPFLAIEGRLYKEAAKNGYCVKKEDGSDYLITVTTFPAALLDLTNPQAVAWIKKIIKEQMINIGLSGWMADYGEYLPVDAKLFSGENPELLHNLYPQEWARINREVIEETGKLGEMIFFSRAGYSNSSAYSLAFWSGDQLVNWSKGDGMPTAITAGISIGFSGVGNYHSDIGGYTTVAYLKRKPELLMRWAEQAAFTPIMRSHESNRPDVNCQVYSSKQLLLHMSRMSTVYTLLKPYHLHVNKEYSQTGLPPIRLPGMHYPEQRVHFIHKYQYLYGRDLFVAPVYKPGKKEWSVVLPDDNWVHLWTGEKYSGKQCKEKKYNRITVPAMLGYPPVFYRQESEFSELFFYFTAWDGK